MSAACSLAPPMHGVKSRAAGQRAAASSTCSARLCTSSCEPDAWLMRPMMSLHDSLHDVIRAHVLHGAQALEGAIRSLEASQDSGLRRLSGSVSAALQNAESSLEVGAAQVYAPPRWLEDSMKDAGAHICGRCPRAMSLGRALCGERAANVCAACRPAPWERSRPCLVPGMAH